MDGARYSGSKTIILLSSLLSGAMLFDYIGWSGGFLSSLTKAGWEGSLEQEVTGDFASQLEGVAHLTTSQFAEELVANIESVHNAKMIKNLPI